MSAQTRLSQGEEPKENHRVTKQSFVQKSSSRSKRPREKLSEEGLAKAAKQAGRRGVPPPQEGCPQAQLCSPASAEPQC